MRKKYIKPSMQELKNFLSEDEANCANCLPGPYVPAPDCTNGPIAGWGCDDGSYAG